MIRARSPLFLLTLGILVALGVGIAWIVFTITPPLMAVESWMKSTNLARFRGYGWTFITSSLGALLIIGLIERAIYLGWEPQWLRHRIPVCTVDDLYIHPNDPEGHRRIEISLLNGHNRWFILDTNEAYSCKIGDVIRLTVIGKYVSDVQVLEASPMNQTATPQFDTQREPTDAEGAQITMALIPVLAGMLLGKGLEHLWFGEFRYWPGKGTEPLVVVVIGVEARVYGAILVILGLTVAGWCARMWIQGWSPVEVSPDHAKQAD